MIRHPSRRYILYLISKRCFDHTAIVATLQDLRLPVPPAQLAIPEVGFVANPTYNDFLTAVREMQSTLQFPSTYDPVDVNPKTKVFLTKLAISSMWERDHFVGAASEILLDPVMKRYLEIMLLGPLTFESISKRMRRRYGLPYEAMNPRVVQAYAHYYWDFRALDREDWEDVVKNWMPGRNNDYLVSLNAPRTKYGAALSAWMADGGVTPLKDTHALRAFRDEAFRHFMQVSSTYSPGWKTSQSMQSYFQVFLNAQEAIEIRQGGTAEVLEELRRIEADFDHSPMQTVHELPAGSLSVIDVQGEELDNEKEPQ